MTATIGSWTDNGFFDGVSAPRPSSGRPAARASGRFWRAGLMLGVLGLVCFALVFIRLFESWRVSPHAVSHHISILSQRLRYPAANTGASIVLALALLGAIVASTALVGMAKELLAARRLGRTLADVGVGLIDGVLMIDDDRPGAFCAGLFRPRVYITSGALAILDEPARDAVLLHEKHHAHRHDPLRLAASRVLTRSLFFLPAMRELRRQQEMLTELSADESAVAGAIGGRSGLARAMLRFAGAGEAEEPVGFDPARVDYLLGEPPTWRFPTLMCIAAVALLGLLVTVAILVGREASGSATLAPPFLSAQPCIVMLAMVPCTIAALAVGIGRGQHEGDF